MNIFEMLSLSWMVFFIIFALVVYIFADREQNKQWVERMGGFIFVNIVGAALIGAMAPHFFVYVLHLPWYTVSGINQIVMLTGAVTAWVIFAWGLIWLAGLGAVLLGLGAITWMVTHLTLN